MIFTPGVQFPLCSKAFIPSCVQSAIFVAAGFSLRLHGLNVFATCLNANWYYIIIGDPMTSAINRLVDGPKRRLDVLTLRC
jgi:hypothetical protein